MDGKLVNKFVQIVKELITDEKDQDSLFDVLKKYQRTSDVKNLVSDMKKLINDPTRLEIYDHIRPLIRPQHQQQYDKLAPNAPGKKLREIKLNRRGNESLGFAVRGGYEHGVGVFVSHVVPGSQAEQKGLKLGDEIVRVNGFTIAQAIHEEVLNLIKGRDMIDLKVTNIGMVPIKQSPTDPVTWQYVEKTVTAKSRASVTSTTTSSSDDNLVKIFINLRGASSLGCTIISGPKQFPGIFIETIRPGSLGADYGLEVGDQLIEVNGKSFLDIKHKEAIVELKGSKELNFVIKKGAGLSLLNLKKGDSTNTVPPRQDPKPTVQDFESEESVCEVLDDGIYSQIDKKKRDEDRQKAQHQAEEERIREEFRRHELRRQMEEEERELAERERIEEEERLREEEEKQRLREEQQRREIEEIKRQQEAKIREENRRKEELEMKRREEAQKKEEEERQRQEVISRRQQSAVLAGRSGPSSSMKPTLLGAAPGAPAFGKTSKKVKEVDVRIEQDMSLDIELEGGTDSPLGGKVVVAEVIHGGAVYKNGDMDVGDTILKVNDYSFDDVTLNRANELLWKAEQETRPGDCVKFVIVESDLPKKDEITFF